MIVFSVNRQPAYTEAGGVNRNSYTERPARVLLHRGILQSRITWCVTLYTHVVYACYTGVQDGGYTCILHVYITCVYKQKIYLCVKGTFCMESNLASI